jgi:NADH:ubiquinone oxidoreductase subunit 2 (subunit N)
MSVYLGLTRFTHLAMITFVNTGFFFILIQILTTLNVGVNYSNIYFLLYSSILTTLVGSLLLLFQNTVRGFLSTNSIINTGLILTAVCSLQVLELFSNKAVIL